MKNLFKTVFAILLSLMFLACKKENSTIENDVQNTSQEIFASKTIEIFEELTTTYFPKEDVKFIVFKDTNGFLKAKYELIGQSKREVEMGSFVSRSANDDGTTCDGKWSCGKAIYECLENGKDALISVGACELSAEYCVKCQEPK